MTRAIAIIYWLFLALVATAIVALPVLAHEDGAMHYPAACCSGQDCAPVDKVEIISTAKFAAAGMGFMPTLKLPSQTVVTTVHGTVVVPEDFDLKATYDSQDGRMHACIRHTAMGLKLICLFKPPGL